MRVLSDEPDEIRHIGDLVSVFEWLPRRPPSGIVGLIPGWGAHPYLYGPLIRELLKANMRVAATWAQGVADVTSDGHYVHLSEFVQHVRRAELPVGFVAESLGATYLLASGLLVPEDRVVLLAPGVLLKPRQILSPRAAGDAIRLLWLGRAPLTGWRLESISDNPDFLSTVRTSRLVPAYSGRRYVWHALKASLRALWCPARSQDMWIIQGERDRLLAVTGATFLAWRLGLPTPKLSRLADIGHGVLWDRARGDQIAAEIAAFFSKR